MGVEAGTQGTVNVKMGLSRGAGVFYICLLLFIFSVMDHILRQFEAGLVEAAAFAEGDTVV